MKPTLQPDRVVPTVSVQPDRIDLPETTTLTLAVEGPAPLRVEFPRESEKLLAPPSAAVWQITPLASPKVQTLEGGRERWEQSFRLSPFAHGERVNLAFAPLRVNGQDVYFEAQTLRVRKTIDEAKAEHAVPVTGIESLPPSPPSAPDASGWHYLGVLGAVFALAVVIVWVRRSRSLPPPMPPLAWAQRELDRLERDSALDRIDVRTSSERLAGILREFVERYHGLPATRLTTEELETSCSVAEWPADRTAPLPDILECCDRAKFAGQFPDTSELLAWIESARAWLSTHSPSPTPT